LPFGFGPLLLGFSPLLLGFGSFSVSLGLAGNFGVAQKGLLIGTNEL
jgi:hypothetical protein